MLLIEPGKLLWHNPRSLGESPVLGARYSLSIFRKLLAGKHIRELAIPSIRSVSDRLHVAYVTFRNCYANQGGYCSRVELFRHFGSSIHNIHYLVLGWFYPQLFPNTRSAILTRRSATRKFSRPHLHCVRYRKKSTSAIISLSRGFLKYL